jgi:hypothetical protein
MSRIVRVILIYHREVSIHLIQNNYFIPWKTEVTLIKEPVSRRRREIYR